MTGELREHESSDLDTGRADVRPVLRQLGGIGAFGTPEADPDDLLLDAVRLVRRLAAASLAAGFAAWSQQMVLEYLRCCPPPDGAGLLPALRAGEVTGATALAPAVSDLAGHAELPVLAASDGDGWRLSGRIGWTSNLFDDAVVVTPARTRDEGRVVAVFRLSAAGVTHTPFADLVGLNGTGTGALDLDGVHVGPGDVLTDDLHDFMAMCRPAMLLMQSALAVGLADAALDSSGRRLAGVGGALRPQHDELTAGRDELVIRLEDLAASRVGVGPGGLARLRLDAMDVAARAVRLESSASGSAGYRAGSATARRVREAAFLPVQAPTEAQLRAEVARSDGR